MKTDLSVAAQHLEEELKSSFRVDPKKAHRAALRFDAGKPVSIAPYIDAVEETETGYEISYTDGSGIAHTDRYDPYNS